MKRIMLILVIMAMAGGMGACAPAVKCPPVPKCPPSYADRYHEAERAADRLEDALRAESESSRACVRVFEDSLKKR